MVVTNRSIQLSCASWHAWGKEVRISTQKSSKRVRRRSFFLFCFCFCLLCCGVNYDGYGWACCQATYICKVVYHVVVIDWGGGNVGLRGGPTPSKSFSQSSKLGIGGKDGSRGCFTLNYYYSITAAPSELIMLLYSNKARHPFTGLLFIPRWA